MNAVVQTVEERGVVAADAGSIMAIIDRAARDPNTDMDKLERLLGMYERITARQAVQSYTEAMSAAQAEMTRVATDANNPQTKSRYATYAALDRELRPTYTKHGFALSFGTAEGGPPEHVRVTCTVAHRDGHAERFHIDMPADGKGAKGGDVMTKTHATGAAMSYGQRYLLRAIFNIAVGDDKDGNAYHAREQSGASEAAMAAINACETLADLKTWKVKNADSLSKLEGAEADEIVRLFNRRVEALKARQ